jgi:hypothetical protein
MALEEVMLGSFSVILGSFNSEDILGSFNMQLLFTRDPLTEDILGYFYTVSLLTTVPITEDILDSFYMQLPLTRDPVTEDIQRHCTFEITYCKYSIITQGTMT